MRPSLRRTEIESQGAQPMVKRPSIAALVVVVIVIVLVMALMLIG